ncbi:MAG: DNA methyltransferase [Blastocatellia bacterium]
MTYLRAISGGYNNKLYAEDAAAHEWYRFVLSFPPHLVRDYVHRFGLGDDHTVLDPFCGTGTTLVECKKLGISSVGIEANPIAHFASEIKLDWSPAPDDLIEHAISLASVAIERLDAEGITDNEDYGKPTLFTERTSINEHEINYRTLPPESFNLLLTDSISPRPLHKALVLLDVIKEKEDKRYLRHELLALVKALVFSISNLHFGPEVGVSRIKKLDTPVVPVWLATVRAMANDLRELQTHSDASAIVHHADARQLKQLIESRSIDAVITSPPYPNEKDYSRTTRLESVLLGFINNKDELKAMKRGLMRSNTRNVYKGDEDDNWVTEHREIQRIAEEIEARRIALGKTSGFEKLYAKVTKLYFGGMTRHLAELREKLRPGAYLAYVVGDQASYFRVMIRTGHLLADIAKSLGYELVDIDLFRSRLATATKEQLREEVVVLHLPDAKIRMLAPIKHFSKREGLMSKSEDAKKAANRYAQIIERIFFSHYTEGATEACFERGEIESVAQELSINLPKNLGDIVYSFRYRVALPESIRAKATEGRQWIIRPAGRSRYCFVLAAEQDIMPAAMKAETKIPDATPGLVTMYSLDDEQALLAKLRYNRLIDVFTGITCYSLQNHLRTFLAGIGQVETDEIYIGVDKKGRHYIFPVQAKGHSDKLNVVQIEQDFALCASKFPDPICRPIGAQFMEGNLIALFEFESTPEGVKITEEEHYRLVTPDEVTPEVLRTYQERLPIE